MPSSLPLQSAEMPKLTGAVSGETGPRCAQGVARSEKRPYRHGEDPSSAAEEELPPARIKLSGSHNHFGRSAAPDRAGRPKTLACGRRGGH